jgi:hypothetical protein
MEWDVKMKNAILGCGRASFCVLNTLSIYATRNTGAREDGIKCRTERYFAGSDWGLY